ncbi:hypothetical protein DAPPUDRAFT_239782 [Daphnia pulex]|uniref:Cuticle protein n=1 Tax=Daphnia pulex TaxID=6669 RepID=E9GA15_DAPPU|nr:hypothetical protein DAPPUDRAFT_239782 [Daphnia pulex]|eukprot:EFX83666.1 hypothetical protein DAPPUDRAFT_239782 [Daphnia pulex]
MNKILVIFAALLAGAWAYNRYEPSYVRFESEESDDTDDYSEPMPYGFEYDVNDGQNNFGHRQQSDGQVTSGSYRVQLPDGRTQIVTYRADHNGYNAKVTYEQTTNSHHYYTHPAYQQYNNPSSHQHSATAAPEPLFYRTRPGTTTTTTPAPVKPLPYRHFPLYEFPGIAPYHGPSNAYGAYDQLGNNDRRPAMPPVPSPSSSSSTTPSDSNNKEDDSSDEELPLVPLIFRTSHVDSYGQQLRSGYGKRSPIDIWSEADISAALDAITPAPVEEQVPSVEAVISSATDEIVVPVDQVESQTDHTDAAEGAAGSTLADDDEDIDFDILPFPLPLPLAYRPDATLHFRLEEDLFCSQRITLDDRSTHQQSEGMMESQPISLMSLFGNN